MRVRNKALVKSCPKLKPVNATWRWMETTVMYIEAKMRYAIMIPQKYTMVM